MYEVRENRIRRKLTVYLVDSVDDCLVGNLSINSSNICVIVLSVSSAASFSFFILRSDSLKLILQSFISVCIKYIHLCYHICKEVRCHANFISIQVKANKTTNSTTE